MANTAEDYQKQLQKQLLHKMLGDAAVGTAAAATPVWLNKLYSNTFLKDIPEPGGLVSPLWEDVGPDTPVGIRKAPMKKFLRRLGVGLNTGYSPGGPRFTYWPDATGGTVYAPISYYASRQAGEGTIGHEAGHAVRHNLRKNRLGRIFKALEFKTYPHVRKVNGVLAGLAGFMPVDSLAADAAVAGGGLLYALPQLSEEIGASRVGARLLRLKGLAKLRTFSGVPAYAINALAPAMAVGVRRGINKLRDRK